MYTYGYSSKNQKNKIENLPIQEYLLLGSIIVFLLWSSFSVALFNGQNNSFEKPIFIASLLTSIIALITIVIFQKNIQLIKQTDLLKWFVLLIPASYALPIISSASEYLSVNMLIISTVYALFFIITVIITQKSSLNNIIKAALFTNAFLIVAFGFIYVFGNGFILKPLLKFLGFKLDSSGNYMDAVMLTNDGLRLTSVFQYANTYAAFLMAFLFSALFSICELRSFWLKYIHAFMLVPIILSILMTLSRGGLILLPVIFVVLLLFLKPHRQIMWILYLCVSGLVTLLILNPVSSIGLEVQSNFDAMLSLKGWFYLITASALTAVISIGLERWVSPWLASKSEKYSKKKWANFFLPSVGIVFGIILYFVLIGTSLKSLLPDTMQSRLESINFSQNSVLERFTFYRDSTKVLLEHPIIGAGGGAWSALYEEYQNNPYTSNQAHSFYMQYLIEVGIVGFIVFVLFLGYIFYHYVRTYIQADQEKRDSYFVYFIIATSILIHSAMDFNMSYVYIGILVFICLGGMTNFIASEPISKLRFKPRTMKTAFNIFIGLIGLVLLITSITFVAASNAFAKADSLSLTSTDYNVISTPLDKALKIRPHHPNYVGMKASMLIQLFQQSQDNQLYNQAETLLKETLKSEPSNKMLWIRLISLYSSKQLEEEIYEIYLNNLHRYPWDIEWYEESMSISARLMSTSINDLKLKKNYYSTIMDLLKQIETGVEYLKTLPEGQLQGRTFEVTPKVALHVGQAYYLNGQTKEASDFMKPYLQEELVVINPNNPNDVDKTNLELLRWYLASCQKLGIEDKENYTKIIRHDPNEDEMIKSIVMTELN